jgi:hypothetical protein
MVLIDRFTYRTALECRALYGQPRFSGRIELQTQLSLLELPVSMGATGKLRL